MIRMPYQGIATFLGSKIESDKKYGFLGIPYDCTTSFRPGARFAPNAIRQASLMLTDGEHPLFENNPCQMVSDYGDVNIPHVAADDALRSIEESVSKLLNKNIHPIIAGGDHTITLGVMRALKQKYGKIGLLHFDAHCDTWETSFGDAKGHGTWVRDVISEEIVNPTDVLQIGIRSPVDKKTRMWLPNQGGNVISARDAMQNNFGVKLLDEWSWDKIPVYISFDIDALDPSYAPGTGTPEVGGLTSIFALQFLESLHRLRHSGLHFVGMDVVEICPAYDVANITSLMAATLLWTYIAMEPESWQT